MWVGPGAPRAHTASGLDGVPVWSPREAAAGSEPGTNRTSVPARQGQNQKGPYAVCENAPLR